MDYDKYKEFLDHVTITILSEYDQAIIAYNKSKAGSKEQYYHFGIIESLSFIIDIIAGGYDDYDIPDEFRSVKKSEADEGISRLKQFPDPPVKL